MAPIRSVRIDEKLLADHPHLAERVRQAEEQQAKMEAGSKTVQPPPSAAKRDAPECPRTGDPDQGGMIHPTRPAAPRKSPYSWLAPAVAIALLAIGGLIYGTGRLQGPQTAQAPAVNAVIAQEGQVSPLVAAMQGDLNRVMGTALAQDGNFGPATLSALQAFEQQRNLAQTQDLDQATWQNLQAVASGFTASPSQQTQAIATPQAAPQQAPSQQPAMQSTQQPAPTVTPTPAQSTAGMTVEQYYAQINMAPGGEPLGANPNAYKEESIYIPGGTYTFRGPAEQVANEWSAAFNLPVSAFENQSRPPITGQINGNSMDVTLEVSGPNGTKTIQGKIDSGTVRSAFPESFLQSLGYAPVSTQAVLGVTGQQTEGVYDIPFIQIRGNGGQWETLYSGTLPVWGDQFDEALVGADVLKQASLSINGNMFVLGFPN